jgi:hypothetical protein
MGQKLMIRSIIDHPKGVVIPIYFSLGLRVDLCGRQSVHGV